MRFLLRNLTSCSINKLTSLKFQVQLPINNVHAIMHGLHDLTGNDDKSLKGESFVCFNRRKINTMKQLTLYFVLLLRGSPSLFSFILFGCFFFFLFFFFGMRSIITMTDVHSMTHTGPPRLFFYPHSPTSKPSHSFISIWLILHSHIYESKRNKTLALEVRLTLVVVNLFRESFMRYNH